MKETHFSPTPLKLHPYTPVFRDFDSITSQVRRAVESLVVQANTQSELQLKPPATTEQVVNYIPTEELSQFFQAELEGLFAQTSLEQIIQFTHYCVHKAVLHPRHTWPKPLWVLTTASKLYIAQASGLEDAIAKVKAQYPQETETLEIVTVGGVLASEQVISLEKSTLGQK
ncbi:MAG: hypothetical protein DSM106950_12050 [Stigonema ocellatum SAG 48.90 = DSM 106950]|nr:hypothetical protein [Stigonema ocellatum SAG 48.90 = DSM 106950]